MALLHSRAARIIFGCTSENGALETAVQLHELPHLNHHYSVYSGCCSQVEASSFSLLAPPTRDNRISRFADSSQALAAASPRHDPQR
jgi:hypothetical protein